MLAAGILEPVLRLFPCPISPVRLLFSFAEDERGYALRPNAEVVFSGVLERLSPPVHWGINSQGLRESKIVSETAASGQHRVAVYGDSEAFGWSVEIEDTFEKQMARMDPSLDVLNFGVPGYSVENVVAHVRQTAPRFHPDHILYLIHPNDLEPPLSFLGGALIHSELARRLAYTYHRIRGTGINTAVRGRADRIATFQHSLRALAETCRGLNVSCSLWFGDAGQMELLQEDQDLRSYFLDENAPRAFDVSWIYTNRPLRDEHLPPETHRELAGFCLSRIPPREAHTLR